MPITRKCYLSKNICLKKVILFLLPTLVLVTSCDFADQSFYREIGPNVYSEFKPVDTLMEKNGIIATIGSNHSDSERTLIRTGQKYFILGPDAYFENDSTIIVYDLAYLIDDDGQFRKNGIWFYTKTEKHRDEILPIFWNTARFYNVDSIPTGFSGNLPSQEGIYLYENNQLKRASKEQSPDAFDAIGKNGFYFLPNKGRLFERHHIKEIQ